ncbi:MAG: hypothetical protein OXS28_21605 [Gammaproteobacteria bacterium]|nr:hypothetical protein [Gammaproteobacteria bacterium]MDE0286924.1 hypothetical protein [Gammaproteobacteria bacterium]
MKFPALWLPFTLILCVASISAAFAQGEAASTEVIETCPMPEKPSIPNGLKSSEEEMLEAQRGIKDYMTKGQAVLTCLDELAQSWGETATEEQLQINNLFHNKMVDEMQSIGELFNSAVRAYKGRNQ